ncbi:hypothetical protein MPNT_260012 [Candidatus Methylacidithermus pantelleriae]|uniref:Uncharacterized protein n=1 Tax=Candidatus Methylacidithermus pantelleriae TaxID=2744239 RepID=A0A8J2BTM5_9BACT|nr:hypothetical protein MPNT_260012 [Candidatus Methylacidithermus pantelleriae]
MSLLACGLTARLRTEWISKGFLKELPHTLPGLSVIRVARLLSEGKFPRRMLCRISKGGNELLQQSGPPSSFFPNGCKWIR